MSLYGKSDAAILVELGQRLKDLRLSQNLSQQSLADITGLSRKTISETEQGEVNISLMTLIQLLRGLNSLDSFNQFLPKQELSPLQIAKLQGKKRQRASRKRSQG